MSIVDFKSDQDTQFSSKSKLTSKSTQKITKNILTKRIKKNEQFRKQKKNKKLNQNMNKFGFYSHELNLFIECQNQFQFQYLNKKLQQKRLRRNQITDHPIWQYFQSVFTYDQFKKQFKQPILLQVDQF